MTPEQIRSEFGNEIHDVMVRVMAEVAAQLAEMNQELRKESLGAEIPYPPQAAKKR
jgi:hypothetical protein